MKFQRILLNKPVILVSIVVVLVVVPSLWLLLRKTDNRPNIILIMADDVSPDLFSCFDSLTPHKGEFSANTPNIDAFTRNGVVFKTAYAAGMCLPARVTLMTGKYGTTTGVLRNRLYLDENHRHFYDDHPPFSRILEDSGYATAIAGKWHAGRQQPGEELLGFSEYCLWESATRIEKSTGEKLREEDVGREGDSGMPSRYWHPCLLRNGERVLTKPDDYGPEICSNFLLDFIERKARKKKPFFAYWSTVVPHVTAAYNYPGTPLEGPVGDMGSPDDDVDIRLAALVKYLDLKVGEIRQKLVELGIADNTLLIFCSDNGTSGEGKRKGVERGCHVVFMAEGAGVSRRGMTEALMDFADIAPTILEYGEAETPPEITFDGISLRPFLRGDAENTKPVIQGLMATSITLRTQDHLLEVVNPILGLPNGRLYSTGENRFWKGYQLVPPGAEFEKAMQPFRLHLARHPPFEHSHPFWETPEGKAFLEKESTPRRALYHLTNSDRYHFYDQPIPKPLTPSDPVP